MPEKHSILSIDFINVVEGWQTTYEDNLENGNGTGKIYFTDNGGINWTEQYTNNYELLRSCEFINMNTGFVTVLNIENGQSQLLITRNGGLNWNKIDFNVQNGLFQVFFINEYTGWLTAINYIFRTTNSGYNWIQYNAPASYIRQINFININTGFALGNKVLKTTNGGINWNVQSQLMDKYFMTHIKFINENTGYISAQYGKIYYSTNSGVNWSDQNSNTKHVLYSILFLNQSTGWIIGEFGTILKTTNGGLP